MGFPTFSNLFQRKYGRSSSLPGHICPSQPTFTVLVHISSGTVCSLKFLTNKSWVRLLGDVLWPQEMPTTFSKQIPQMVDLYMWICGFTFGKIKNHFQQLWENWWMNDETTGKRWIGTLGDGSKKSHLLYLLWRSCAQQLAWRTCINIVTHDQSFHPKM